VNINNVVNSYKYLDVPTKRLVKTWKKLEGPKQIPWTPLTKPIAESTVALLSSAGLALKTDKPFNQEGERRNPWWGDPSFRVLPRAVKASDVKLYHLHMNSKLVDQDLNTFFPLQTAIELEVEGVIGNLADRHYSYMGYILEPQVLLEESLPPIIASLKNDQVDAVIMVPG